LTVAIINSFGKPSAPTNLQLLLDNSELSKYTQRRYEETAMSMHCPRCGGQLVWDYRCGEVVCSACGTVVEKIFDYSPMRPDESEEIWREIRIRRNPKHNSIARKYRRDYKLYVEAERYVRGKPWLELDYDKYFETGKLVNTIKSKATIKAEKKIGESGLWDIVVKGLEIVESVNPALLSRTPRGKYALAYIVATYLEKRTFPPLSEVMEVFNVSETSYRRLLKLAKNLVIVRETAIQR